jgi:hypothetical protein
MRSASRASMNLDSAGVLTRRIGSEVTPRAFGTIIIFFAVVFFLLVWLLPKKNIGGCRAHLRFPRRAILEFFGP